MAESSVQTENLKATDEDFEDLVNTIRGVWLSSLSKSTDNMFNEEKYLFDSTSDSALPDAMYMIQNQGVCLFNNLPYEKAKRDSNENKEATDPLNKFNGVTYRKLDANQVDWILENVLCVTPDRTKTDDDFDTSKYYGIFNYYYYDGYYYYAVEDGGGGGNYPEIIDYSEQPDGSYIVKFSTEDKGDSLYKYDYDILEASVALKDVDGERVWAVSYLKVLEHIDVEN
ncbi:MAG: hypothetical protein ACI4IX_03690, partial [Acutalibacteraceae bacterium]